MDGTPVASTHTPSSMSRSGLVSMVSRCHLLAVSMAVVEIGELRGVVYGDDDAIAPIVLPGSRSPGAGRLPVIVTRYAQLQLDITSVKRKSPISWHDWLSICLC